MIETALSELGGVQYLVRQAKENPVAFLHLLGRLLPRDVNVAETSGRAYVITPEQAKSMKDWTDSVGDDDDDPALN